MRYPVYVDGSIPLKALLDALSSCGYHLRIDAGHRWVVDPLPTTLLKGATSQENVLPLAKRRRG